PLAPFGIDAGLTLASRILNGERWWEPHATHAYQRWARRAGHGTVALAYAAWTLAGVALMLWLPAGSGWSLAAAAGLVLCGAGAVALALRAARLAGVALMLWLPAGGGWRLAAAAGCARCGAGAWWMGRTRGNKRGDQGREGNG